MPKRKVKQSNQNNKTQYSIQQNNPSIWKFDEEARNRLKDFIIKEQSEKILFCAISAKDLAAVKAFSEKGFTIPNYKNDLKFPFYKSLLLEDNVELLKYLIEELNFDLKDLACLNDNTLLNLASSIGANKCIKLLIEKGFDINQLGYHTRERDIKYSALEVAIMANKPNIAKFLATNNAKFNDNTFEILAISLISPKVAHDILEIAWKSFSNSHMKKKGLDKLKKEYTQKRKGVKPSELEIITSKQNADVELICKTLHLI